MSVRLRLARLEHIIVYLAHELMLQGERELAFKIITELLKVEEMNEQQIAERQEEYTVYLRNILEVER